MEGVKILGLYWTLGRYDGVTIIERKDEKTAIHSAMKNLLKMGDIAATETLIVIPREEVQSTMV
jgi:uncharacterized protein with GYD domain